MALEPQVISTYPLANASGIPVNTVISGAFNIPMDPTTINVWTFMVTDKATGTAVDGTTNYLGSAKIAQFTPKRDLYHYADYMAIIVGGPAGVAADNGNRLRQSYSWFFRTGNSRNSGSATVIDTSGWARTLPPSEYIEVESVFPRGYSTGVSRNIGSVNIEFNTRPVSGDISKYITVAARPVV